VGLGAPGQALGGPGAAVVELRVALGDEVHGAADYPTVGPAGLQRGDAGRRAGLGRARVGDNRGVPGRRGDVFQVVEHVDIKLGRFPEGARVPLPPDSGHDRVQAPADAAGGLGGGGDQELAFGPGQGAGPVLGDQHSRCRLEGDDADPPGQVQVQLAGHDQARGRGLGQEQAQAAGFGHGRDHHEAGRVGRDHVPAAPGQPPAAGPVAGPDAAWSRHPPAGHVGRGHRRGHRADGQQRKPPLAGLPVTSGQQRSGRHRAGQEWARVQDPAELGMDRAGLEL
jgi:hypothetical protein